MNGCKVICVVAALLSAFVSEAADADSLANIQGKIQYAEGKGVKGMEIYFDADNAIVTLYYRHDGRIDSLQTTSDRRGRFFFKNLDPQRIGLKVRKMGRRTITGVYDIEAGENAFYFYLEKKTEELSAASVSAEIPLVKQIQDTTLYNTQAVRTMEDENLAEVLKSLPGFEVSDGGVKVNGVDVKKTYVNGRLIFGDDVTAALNLLRAKEVTQVKVYDEQTAVDRRRGHKNSQKERVLDIITTEKFLSALFASLGATGGADGTGQIRYGASAAGRYDSEMMNIDISGGGTNLTESTPKGFDAFLYAPSSLGDYLQSEGAGVYFQKYWKDRNFGNSLRVSYDFTHNYSKSSSVAMNEYFKTDDNPAMKQIDSLMNSSNDYTHTFDVYASLMDTKIKSVSFGVGGSFTDRSSDCFNGSFKKTDGMPDERRHETSGADGNEYSLMGSFQWTNNDPVKWRPSVSLDGSYSNNRHFSWTVDTLATSYLQRQLRSDGLGEGASANAKFDITGILANSDERTINATFGAGAGYNYGKSRQMSLNEWDVPSAVCDTANSYDFTNHYVDAGAWFRMQYSDSRQRNLAFDLLVHDRYLIDNEYFPFDFNANGNYIAPEFDLRYNSRQNFALKFNGNMRAPAIEQIRNRISDSNPMLLTGGNPNLKYAYDFLLWSSYTFFNRRDASGLTHSLRLEGGADCTLGPIVQLSKYFYEDTVLEQWDGYRAKAGSMLYTYTNSELPAWNVHAELGYSGSVKGSKFSYSTSVGGRYSQTPQYAFSSPVVVGEAGADIKIRLGYRPSRKFNLSVAFNPSYRESRDNCGAMLSGRFILNGNAGLGWSPLMWMTLGCNYSYSGYLYVDGLGIDHNRHLLAASVNFIPFKDRSLKIRLSANDLLNSGSAYRSEVTASKMSQTWTMVYGRFYLLSVVYEFRYKNIKKQ